MRVLMAVLVTAVVTFFATNIWARHDGKERFAKLLWSKCPQVILDANHPERAFIPFLDGGYYPIRPRRTPAGSSTGD